MVVKKYSCRACGSFNIVKNGRNKYGSQQYLCKDCRASKVLEPKVKYSEERKEEILRAYQERSSLRGVARIFGVSRQTIMNWLKKSSLIFRPFPKRWFPLDPTIFWSLTRFGVSYA